MITISINGRLLDAVYALVMRSLTAGAQAVEKPEAPVETPVEKPEAPAGGARKKSVPREHEAVTRPDAPVRAVVAPVAPVKPAEAPVAPKAPAPVTLDDEWPATLTKPSSWNYDGQGASWRAANQIGTAELGAAIQRVYIDHADIVKMPSVRVAMSKLGVEGWWRCVAKNIAEARDASNRPLDITPKREAKND